MFLKTKVNSCCSVTVSTKCFSMCLCVHVCLFIVASTAQCCIVCGPTLSFLAGQNPRKQERNPNKDTGVRFFHIFLHLTLPVSTSSHHWTPNPLPLNSPISRTVFLLQMHIWVSWEQESSLDLSSGAGARFTKPKEVYPDSWTPTMMSDAPGEPESPLH